MSQSEHATSMWDGDEQARRREDKRSNVSTMVRAVESGERYTIERSGEPDAVVIPYTEHEHLNGVADRLSS
jgi:prevent-host-death family protein